MGRRKKSRLKSQKYRLTPVSVGIATVRLALFKCHASVATFIAQNIVILKLTTVHSTTINNRKAYLRRTTHRLHTRRWRRCSELPVLTPILYDLQMTVKKVA